MQTINSGLKSNREHLSLGGRPGTKCPVVRRLREPSSRARAARFTLPRPSLGLGSAAPVTQPPAQHGLADAREKATLGPRRSPGWGSPLARALRLPKTGPAGRRTADPRRRSGNASSRPRSAGVRGAAGRGRARARWSAASALPSRWRLWRGDAGSRIPTDRGSRSQRNVALPSPSGHRVSSIPAARPPCTS